jgi:uncharacterized protein with PIN domain
MERYLFCEICFECGGRVELTPANGRKREVKKGLYLDIPSEFEIPTCKGCGEEIWSPELSKAIDEALKGEVERCEQKIGIDKMKVM